MKFICPLLVVSDIAKSRAFYEYTLGQKIKYDFGENITFHGDFSIHLDTHFKGLINQKEIAYGANNMELYFEEDKIDELVDRLIILNTTFVHELREQPWRQRVVRFYDPDQHIIEVGERMEYLAYRLSQEGSSHQEIAETIQMPLEFVSQSIQSFSN